MFAYNFTIDVKKNKIKKNKIKNKSLKPAASSW